MDRNVYWFSAKVISVNPFLKCKLFMLKIKYNRRKNVTFFTKLFKNRLRACTEYYNIRKP